MSETSYQVGKTLGQSRWIVLTVVIVALGSCMWLGKRAEEQRVVETARLAKEKELARKREEELVAKREAETAAACTRSGPHFAAASAEAARGRMHDAFRALDTCRQHLSDPAVKALYVKAMEAARKKDEADGQRMIAAAKARKKKEGVQLGMSQQDVLDSSWGRPEKVNRTTNRYGTSEQWVYPGGYLYFENGVLTSVQH